MAYRIRALLPPSIAILAPAGAGLPFLRLVDPKRAAVQFDAVERLEGGARIGFGLHLDEGEAAGAARVPVGDDGDVLDLPRVLPERLRDRVLGGVEG